MHEAGPRSADAPPTTLLITFEKAGPARWLGHLDVMRAFERGLRRAGVSVALTQGHNPRPRLRFVFPAGVGLICHADLVFADIRDSAESVGVEQLNACLPGGLRVIDIAEPDGQTLAEGPARYSLAEYRITLSVPAGTDALTAAGAAETLMAAKELPVARASDGKPRTVDIRPFVCGAACDAVGDGRAVFSIIARFGNAGSVRPSELADALAREIPGAETALMERMRLMSR